MMSSNDKSYISAKFKYEVESKRLGEKYNKLYNDCVTEDTMRYILEGMPPSKERDILYLRFFNYMKNVKAGLV